MAYPSKLKRNKELVKMLEQGSSMAEVGNFFNLAKSTVHELYHKWAPIYGKKARSGLSTKKELTSVRG